MARKVKHTKRALTSYQNILKFLSKEFRDSTTQKFIKRTYSFLDIVVDFPLMGIKQNNKGIYAFVIEKQLTVFYRFSDEELIVLNYFDTRQHPKKNKL